jgi:hypothetical protein
MRFPAPRPAFGCKPLSFGRRPAGDGLPAPHVDRAAARRTARLAEAAGALAVLPGPGEAVHCLMTGRYDLMHLLVCLIDRLGAVDVLRIATLSYNGRNLAEMVRLLDSGAVRRLTLLCSAFFRDHNTELWEETLGEFRGRGQRAAAARSHAKVATFAFGSGRRLTAEGSANLRSNGNREQLLLADGAPLHDWHAAWIDDLAAAHGGSADEGEQGDHPGQD